MKIGVIGSMQHTEKMLEARNALIEHGHDAFVVSIFTETFLGKNDIEKEELKIHQKNNLDAMRQDCERLKDVDAVLAMNIEKNGEKNYIGGNTFLEIGYAHILDKKLYLYNPIPENPYYKTEIVAMKPVVINGDYSLIK
ncbi:MAG TPA: hypothetical protein VLE93_00600 [Candidatus Saccharimonadales bacterium]|nr:hypothetical protein [Candidatus Saccharimonadales bacterium]